VAWIFLASYLISGFVSGCPYGFLKLKFLGLAVDVYCFIVKGKKPDLGKERFSELISGDP
jgi:hypothetical protein